MTHPERKLGVGGAQVWERRSASLLGALCKLARRRVQAWKSTRPWRILPQWMMQTKKALEERTVVHLRCERARILIYRPERLARQLPKLAFHHMGENGESTNLP